MKSKRNTLMIALVLAFSLVLAACSPGQFSSSEGASGTKGDILVAYFSYTGNTEEVAGQIADLTGGTLGRFSASKNTVTFRKRRKPKFWKVLGRRSPSVFDNVEDYDTVLWDTLSGGMRPQP